MIVRKYTIVVRGEDDDDIDAALAEAVRQIAEGNIEGHDRNRSGGFYFTIAGDIPKSEWPR